MVQADLYRMCCYLNILISSSTCAQILFLNKNDLFENKVKHSDIKNFFPVSPSRHFIPYMALIQTPLGLRR